MDLQVFWTNRCVLRTLLYVIRTEVLLALRVAQNSAVDNRVRCEVRYYVENQAYCAQL